MSLDVYLKGVQNLQSRTVILVREDGAVRELTRAEWDTKYPDREPILVELPSDSEEVFSANITHNLGEMAEKAGIYEALWRPTENGLTHAKQLIEPLTLGLERLKSDPDYYKTFNPPNGWGNYDNLVGFVESYLEACTKYLDAEVSAWR